MRLALAILWMLTALLPLQAAQVQANLAPTTAHVGDTLSLKVSVQGASGKPLSFGSPESKDLSILRVDSTRWSVGELSYVVAWYDTGRQEIPPFPVVMGMGAAAESLFTPVVTAHITTILPDTAQVPRPIKPYREHPFQWRELISYWWLPACLLALVLLWWVYRRFRKVKSRAQDAALVPLLPPDEEAVRNLIRLKDQKYPARGMLKEFFTEFSLVMRRYLERRYKFPALEMTTYELSREFAEGDFPPMLTERLLPVLREADLVKFAKLIPDFAECDGHLNAGFEIVAATRAQVESVPEAVEEQVA
jgi:hypothetical protein